MKKYGWLAGLVAMAFAAAPALWAEEGDEGAPAGRGKEEGKPAVRGDARARGEGAVQAGLPREIAQMVEELKVTDEQKKSLNEKVEAKTVALDKWRKDNEAKLKDIQESLKKAQDEMRALTEEQRKTAKAADEEIMGVFTKEQLALWEALKVGKMYQHIGRGEGGGAPLTKEQSDKIQVLCEEAAKELVAAEAATQPSDVAAAKKEVLHKLQKTIYDDVLTADQRDVAPKPQAPRKGRGGGEGGEDE